MEITKLDNKDIVIINADEVLIKNGQSTLDLIMSVRYDMGCSNIIINKENIDESFFDLKAGLAGEITQKIANYRFRLAIIGDFSIYTSKNFQDYIYECNKGNIIFFAKDVDAAVEKLSRG